MRDDALLKELLEAETEDAVLKALNARGLLDPSVEESRWRFIGDMPNNQSIVNNQQSNATAALIEKFTNGLDALLLRRCKASGIDPHGPDAPQSMSKAVERFYGEIAGHPKEEMGKLAEENLLLYATGTKERPSLSIYDNGEGQFPQNFASTFCSLIFGERSAGKDSGSYKGATSFLHGRFNMGGTGVLPFCSRDRKLQLIVSRVPEDVAQTQDHEWGYTLFCFFPSKQRPAWKYLVGPNRETLTAGAGGLGLVPKAGAKSGELCAPRERIVSSGTLVKMYDFAAPRSNICGELYKKINDYLLEPAFPLRLIECRDSYKANVMRSTVWNRLGEWSGKVLEPGYEDGASIAIELENGETISGEIRVFKSVKDDSKEVDPPQTGLRALINGQSHAKRDAQFFRAKGIDKEHIAGSLLVTLDCTNLGTQSRNSLFMPDRERFREDQLLAELLRKLQQVLHDHEGLAELNKRRYEEKVANAVDDEDGISALEELLATDPALADLFGGKAAGRVAAKTSTDGAGGTIPGAPEPFEGRDFPTFVKRKDGSTSVVTEIHQGDTARVSFLTDVKNNYFSRRKHQGKCTFSGTLVKPAVHLFNGRITFTCSAKNAVAGQELTTGVSITDNKSSGPFNLQIKANVLPPRERTATREPTDNEEDKDPPEPRVQAGPSRPDIKEIDKAPTDPPLTIEKAPGSSHLQLFLNRKSNLLEQARSQRPPEECAAVNFVFKYGLALVAMGLLDSMKKSERWATKEAECRQQIVETTTGVARVIVPLVLSLPKKLPARK